MPVKDLSRPVLTYLYNMEMNQVNQGDQRRASYQIQQRQQKAWKAMFYTTIGIIVVNSFLLSLHSPMDKKEKFTKHMAFREALYKGLFDRATGAAGAGGADVASVIIAGPMNAAEALFMSDTVAMTCAGIKHQRIGMKRGLCVVCKQIAAEKRRGVSVGGKRGQALQVIAPNIVSKRQDKHIARATTGCDACKVLLYMAKGCWEAFHSVE